MTTTAELKQCRAEVLRAGRALEAAIHAFHDAVFALTKTSTALWECWSRALKDDDDE